MAHKFGEIDYDLKFPNGVQVTSEIDLVAAVMYMYGLNGIEARRKLVDGSFSEEDLQRAIDYWVEKTDGDRHWDESKNIIPSIVNNILEGKDIRSSLGESLEYATQKEALRTALASFPSKCNKLWEYLGDIHDIAVNLKKYGRDYVDEYDSGALDRKYLDWIIKEAQKVQDYWDSKIKARVDAWKVKYGITEDRFKEDFKLGYDTLQNLSELKTILSIDPDTIDLSLLKNMF